MKKFVITTLLLFVSFSYADAQTIQLTEDTKPIVNPIKGFKGWDASWDAAFFKKDVGLASTKRLYIPLDSLIRKISDNKYEVINNLKLTHFVKTTNKGSFKKEIYPGVLDALFENNIKIIPRVVAHTDPGYEWLTDLNSSSYYKSEEFQNMLKFLIPKLVQKWDNDSNIAYIEMGFVGSYGEFYVDKHDYTFYDEKTLSILNSEFSKFTKKHVTTAGIAGYNNVILEYIPSTILSNNFGVNWDSFISTPLIKFFGLALEGEPTQNWTGNKKMNINLWKTKPYVGEVAYNINVPNTGLGGMAFNDTATSLRMKQSVEDPVMVDILVKNIKKYHMSDLSWISNYKRDKKAKVGAEKIHKALGYRFVLKDATYEINANQGEKVDISFKVSNDGSAPFYYKWSLVVSLIDKDFNIVSDTKTDVDITKWIEGDYSENISFKIPSNIPNGKYYIALSIQEKNTPSLRFANINYFNGGYTPIGKIGIKDEITSQVIKSTLFDKTDKDPKFNQVITANLKEGWNFVGINSNLTLEYLKKELGDGNIINIKGANKVYKASNLELFNDFSKFEQGEGYWIKLNTLEEIKYTPEVTSNTISLKKGWNIINPTSNLTFSQILAQIGESNLEQIRGAEKIYKKTNPADMNTFEAFQEPYGYWIKVKENTLLKF